MSDHPEADKSAVGENYDATRDPRTGRPPDPAEAQRLAREHQNNRMEGQVGEDPLNEEADPPGIEGRQPARMASPQADDSEQEAIEALVEEGVNRERAEELVTAHGANLATLKGIAFAQDDVEPKQPK